MKRTGKAILLALTITFLFVMLIAPTALGQSSGGSFVITSHTVAGGGCGPDGGGGCVPSTGGGTLSLEGTAGQHDAADLLRQPPYSLRAGFWYTTLGLTPTASNGTVTGRIIDSNGVAVEGAVVRLGGTQNRKFITDANGFYRFENVETNGFYTVTPSRVNLTFSPAVRSFSLIGENAEATFGATATNSALVNPLDTAEYFVRQHYLDFLNREPDEAGFNFWSDQMLECGADTGCRERRRVNVSAAYFLSIEFQQTGGLVDSLYRASYARAPRYAEFMPDTRRIAENVVVGRSGWEQQLHLNKQAFVDGFVQRAEFRAAFDSLSNENYIDRLIEHTGVSFTNAERTVLVEGLNLATLSRARALQRVAENREFRSAKHNEAFVMMEYFGYLRRDPDQAGFDFWLRKLNDFNGNFEQAEMVKAFINSGEYRARFAR